MRFIESTMQDFRYSLRAMRSSIGLTAVAVLSLALGIGATTAIFSVLYALILKPLPVQQPDQLVEVARSDGPNLHSYPAWKELRDKQDIFSDAFAFNYWDTTFNLADGQEKQKISGLYVSGDYFSTLGVPAVLGRTLQSSDDQTSASPVCVIGYGLWQSRYGRSHTVIGRTLVLNGHAFQVVGVVPSSFFGVEVGERPEVFMPLEIERLFRDYPPFPNGRATPTLDTPYAGILGIVARLKPGISVTHADARLRILGPQIFKTFPPLLDRTGHPLSWGTFVARAMPNGMSGARYDYGDTVLLLMTMAGVALVIACANLGNLLLARAAKRRSEIATRFALGATRGRLIRQLLTESIALSLAGALAGLIIERWGSAALVSAIPASRPGQLVSLDLSWDARLVGFAVGTTLLCAVLFGLAPAFRATDLSLYSAMTHGSAGGTGRHRFSNSALIVVQVTLSMALLVSAGLLTRTLHALLAKDPGYDPNGVLVAQASWDGSSENSQRQIFESGELLKTLRSLPGVTSASGTAASGGTHLPVVIISQPGSPERRPRSFSDFISSGYFQTMRTSILSGRDFDDRDNQSSPPVAILSDQAAKTFFPGVNPVGLRYREVVQGGENNAQEYSVEVVGVARDIDYQRPSDSPLAMVYRPASQCIALCSPLTRYHLRFSGPSTDLIKRVKESAAAVDSQISLEFRPLADDRNDTIQRNRAAAVIAMLFGLFTGLLAMIGVYGVTSYATSERTREIGIRIALGAQRANVFRLILGDTLAVVLVGVVLGVASAYGAAQTIREMLWRVSPADPWSFISSACLMLLIAGIAAFLPARRASKADPIAALRFE